MKKILKVILVIILAIIIFIGTIYIISARVKKQQENENETKVNVENNTTKIEKISTYDRPIIPRGFIAVETETASWEIENGIPKGLNNGLVIEDKLGNQFVWIPVVDLIDHGKDEKLEKDFKQIYQYGGFYIARYEAGMPEEYIVETGEDEIEGTFNNKSNIPTSKKEQIPWNNITWGNAKESAINMYKDYEFISSDIITKEEWDYVMEWIEKSGYNIVKCADWGNFSNVNFKFTGYYSTNGKTYKYAKDKMKQTENMILSTGATERNKANNIYDLAGNLTEMLDVNTTSDNVYDMGGYYDNISTSLKTPIDGRNSKQGFRVVLYLETDNPYEGQIVDDEGNLIHYLTND